MRLLFLADGASIHNYRWIKYFVERGHSVDWVTFSPRSVPHIEGVRIHHFGPYPHTGLEFVYATLRVRALIRNVRPQLLHSHYAGTYGLVGSLCGFQPFVVTAWGTDVLISGRKGLKKHLLRLVLRRAVFTTCDAQHLKKAMVELGADPSRVIVNFFGTDTRQFSPSAKDPGLRQRIGIGDAPTVISLRSLEPIYDIPTLIRAVPSVVQAKPGTKFVVAGAGSQKDALVELANELGISEAVVFVGLIPNEELPFYLTMSDVYVSTSLSDGGLASSTAEAMACGLPVVVTDFGENSEWVVNGQNGFLIPSGDSATLAVRIVQLLNDEAMRRTYGAAGRQLIEQKNNYYVQMANIESLYEQAIR